MSSRLLRLLFFSSGHPAGIDFWPGRTGGVGRRRDPFNPVVNEIIWQCHWLRDNIRPGCRSLPPLSTYLLVAGGLLLLLLQATKEEIDVSVRIIILLNPLSRSRRSPLNVIVVSTRWYPYLCLRVPAERTCCHIIYTLFIQIPDGSSMFVARLLICRQRSSRISVTKERLPPTEYNKKHLQGSSSFTIALLSEIEKGFAIEKSNYPLVSRLSVPVYECGSLWFLSSLATTIKAIKQSIGKGLEMVPNWNLKYFQLQATPNPLICSCLLYLTNYDATIMLTTDRMSDQRQQIVMNTFIDLFWFIPLDLVPPKNTCRTNKYINMTSSGLPLLGNDKDRRDSRNPSPQIKYLSVVCPPHGNDFSLTLWLAGYLIVPQIGVPDTREEELSSEYLT